MTNEELHNYALKRIQEWFIEKYCGKIFQTFTYEARRMVGTAPYIAIPIKKDNVEIHREFCLSRRMIFSIKIIDKQTNFVVFCESFVYYNNLAYPVVYNLHNVYRNISSCMDRMVISNDGD